MWRRARAGRSTATSGRDGVSAHDSEKWVPVFGQGPAQPKGCFVTLQRIAVVGAGAWGTALANTAARAGRDVTLWARDPAIVTQLTTKRENPRLPRIRLDNRIAATGAIADLAHADTVLLAVPAQELRV